MISYYETALSPLDLNCLEHHILTLGQEALIINISERAYIAGRPAAYTEYYKSLAEAAGIGYHRSHIMDGCGVYLDTEQLYCTLITTINFTHDDILAWMIKSLKDLGLMAVQDNFKLLERGKCAGICSAISRENGMSMCSFILRLNFDLDLANLSGLVKVPNKEYNGINDKVAKPITRDEVIAFLKINFPFYFDLVTPGSYTSQDLAAFEPIYSDLLWIEQGSLG